MKNPEMNINTHDGASQPGRAVLAIGGLDSSGGAGLTADYITITTLGMDAALACAAVTAQSASGVKGIWPVAPQALTAQMAAAFEDYDIRAIKTGMLADENLVEAVAGFIAERSKGADSPPLIIDPVLAAGRGGELLTEKGVEALIRRLAPLAAVITPNLSEAARLAGFEVGNIGRMKDAARKIHEFGPRAVIVKGGHLVGSATDIIFDGESFDELPGKRYPGTARGTGCAFASALAAHLAMGMPLVKAAAAAKHMATLRVQNAI